MRRDPGERERRMGGAKGEGKRFACPWMGCAHTSRQRTNVRQHFYDVHLKQRRLACHLCDRRFNHKNNLRFHMRCHAKEGHDIDACSHCLTHLSWTPGRGKRALLPNPPATLDVHDLTLEKSERARQRRQQLKQASSPAIEQQVASSSSVTTKADLASQPTRLTQLPPSSSHSCDGSCSSNSTSPSTVREAVQLLFDRHEELNRSWDEVMEQIVRDPGFLVSHSQDGALVDGSSRKSSGSSGVSSPDREAWVFESIRKRIRSPMFMCPKLHCDAVLSSPSALETHVATHEEKSQERETDAAGDAGKHAVQEEEEDGDDWLEAVHEIASSLMHTNHS